MSGELVGWGWNYLGQLGKLVPEVWSSPQKIELDTTSKVTNFDCGNDFSMFVTGKSTMNFCLTFCSRQ